MSFKRQEVENLEGIYVHIMRLGQELMRLNDKYINRVAEVQRLHAKGVHNYSGSIGTVLDNDIILNGAAGAAKTISTLIAGMSAVLRASIDIQTIRKMEAPRE